MIAQTDTAAMDLTSEQHTFLKQLQDQTASLREKLVDHRLYRCMNDPRSVRIFMQLHVFVVWDFPS